MACQTGTFGVADSVNRGSRESGRIREPQAALRFRAIFFEAGRVRACCSEVPERVADFRLL